MTYKIRIRHNASKAENPYPQHEATVSISPRRDESILVSLARICSAGTRWKQWTINASYSLPGRHSLWTLSATPSLIPYDGKFDKGTQMPWQNHAASRRRAAKKHLYIYIYRNRKRDRSRQSDKVGGTQIAESRRTSNFTTTRRALFLSGFNCESCPEVPFGTAR